MPYVIRDSTGKIAQVFDQPATGADEQIANDSAELREFLDAKISPEELRRRLAESDLGMGGLVEDLVDLLIAKGVSKFTDLPPAAGAKYLQRQAAREQLQTVRNLIVEEKGIF